MAQVSRPQPGNVVTTPAYVDAGPYTADQWADRLRVAYTVDETTMGPLLGIDSELAVTYGGLNVTVAKGAGLCDGHLLFNTTAATIAVNGPAGGTRTDYVCMVENNGAAQIPVGALTNYDTAGNVAIPPFSCRLAVVKDCPTNFSQTNALYMVRLATITTQAAAITSLTDNRTFCQFATDLQDNVVTTAKLLNLAVTTAKIDDNAVTPAKVPDRTRTFFVPATGGWNATSASYLDPAYLPGILTFAESISDIFGYFIVPSDYVSGMTIQVVVDPTNETGNVRSNNIAYYAACSESITNAYGESGTTVATITQNQNNCINTVTMPAALAVGDIVRMWWRRYGADALDTVTDVGVSGWIVSYTADS